MKKKLPNDLSSLPLFQTDEPKKKEEKNEVEQKTVSQFSALSEMLGKYQVKEKNKFVSREFQDYGYRLAAELNDLSHKSLYIKLAKTVDRGILESARSFVIDSQAKSKAKLFMWKMKELRAKNKEKVEHS